ncbi:MAG: indolepyruvate oxidoreductase subunit beta, partial [Candidatus Competibacteraceae bacterium]|nr:indolepyruvate oxidoreductase subunit beta [Candidatus Competibacteraceae bacterium]
GGVVSSHVRFGAKVYSPQIDPGEADLLIGFEAAEALRWLPHLRPTGVAMVNTLRLAPPVVSAGLYDYPADPIAELAASGIEVHAFNAGAIADGLGNAKLVNTIMLGAISDHLPFPAEVLKECIIEGFRAYKPKLADINAQAFDAGRTAGQAA